jgi:hypothetical protein
MKRLITLLAAVAFFFLTPVVQAQPNIFTGTYTADLGCIAVPNATIDAQLTAKAPYLKRAATVTPAGTHPVCPFTLTYDDIVVPINGVPVHTGAGPHEQTMLVIDLELAPGATCNNLFFPLGPPPYAAIIQTHQDSLQFVGSSISTFNYDAHLGAAVVTPTTFVMNTLDVFAPLNYSASFSNRTTVTNTSRLSYLASRVNAPIFGTLLPTKVWSKIDWNINTTTAKSENAVIQISGGNVLFPTGVNHSSIGINNQDLGWIRLEQAPFSSTIPVTCL